MYKKDLNTWAIIGLLPVILLQSCLGLPVNNAEKIQETMYEAVVKECPFINKTNIKSDKIFTEVCTDWKTINGTNKFDRESTPNVRCLIYYESLVSFCTAVGDDLIKYKNLLTPDLKDFSLEKVCQSNSSLYPTRNKPSHNISSLIPGKKACMLLCADFTPSYISNLCQLASYFSNFNVTSLQTPPVYKPLGYLQRVQGNIKTEAVNSTLNKVLKTNVNSNAVVSELNKKKVETSQNNEHHLQHQQTTALSISANNTSLPLIAKQKPTLKDGSSDKSLDIASPDKVEDVKTEPHKDHVPASPDMGPLLAPNIVASNNQQSKNIVSLTDQETNNGLETNNENKPLKDKKTDDAVQTNIEENLQSPIEASEDKSAIFDDLQQEELADEGEEEGEQETGQTKVEAVMPVKPNDAPLHSQSKKLKPNTVEDEPVNNFKTPDDDDMDGDSYFFSYFTVIMCLFVVGYVGYHNRQKILALILEGKRGRRSNRSRRPNSANYHKLDSNLEEAISSSCTKNPSNVIY